MTETAGDLIKDSLTDLVVQASEQPLTSDETSTALRYLNRMMTRLDGVGVKLGYTKVNSLSDTLTVPDGALDGMRSMLALLLAPQFDVPITPELREAYEDGEMALYSLGVTIGEQAYPSRLPYGSGNEGSYALETDHFYPDQQNIIRTEDNQFIQAEDNTPDG